MPMAFEDLVVSARTRRARGVNLIVRSVEEHTFQLFTAAGIRATGHLRRSLPAGGHADRPSRVSPGDPQDESQMSFRYIRRRRLSGHQVTDALVSAHW